MRTARDDSAPGLLEEAQRCARCGKCKSLCPLFARDPREANVARGKIALAQEFLSGGLDSSRRLHEYIYSCLLCMRCRDVCPSGVDYVRLVHGVRAFLDDRRGAVSLAREAMRAVLPRRTLLDLGLRAARRFQKTAADVPLRHLPLFVLNRLPVPDLAPRTALSRFAGVHGRRGTRPRVCLFLGCLINYVYPGIAEAFIELAQRAGFEVVVPDRQLCCGAPALSLGDAGLARKLARRNLEVFLEGDYDHVVTACASCARMLMREYSGLVGERFDPVARRLREASQFLVRFAEPFDGRVEEPVTYHDPCHLYYGLGIRSEPRELLARHAHFVELDAGGACCGLGGAFAGFFPDLARSIGVDRIRSVRSTGAAVVASACPGCILQLSSCAAADPAGAGPMRVKHVLEIVLEASSRPKVTGVSVAHTVT